MFQPTGIHSKQNYPQERYAPRKLPDPEFEINRLSILGTTDKNEEGSITYRKPRERWVPHLLHEAIHEIRTLSEEPNLASDLEGEHSSTTREKSHQSLRFKRDEVEIATRSQVRTIFVSCLPTSRSTSYARSRV